MEWLCYIYSVSQMLHQNRTRFPFQIQYVFRSKAVLLVIPFSFSNRDISKTWSYWKSMGPQTSHKYLRENINKCMYFAHSSNEFINLARSP